jgi:hypothetical protein
MLRPLYVRLPPGNAPKLRLITELRLYHGDGERPDITKFRQKVVYRSHTRANKITWDETARPLLYAIVDRPNLIEIEMYWVEEDRDFAKVMKAITAWGKEQKLSFNPNDLPNTILGLVADQGERVLSWFEDEGAKTHMVWDMAIHLAQAPASSKIVNKDKDAWIELSITPLQPPKRRLKSRLHRGQRG